MGIQSATNAALSGITAATAMIDAATHNLANSQTPAYRAQEVVLATQAGGGVQVVAIVEDPTPGGIREEDQLPLLALDGEGLFILERGEDERVYTRDGHFSRDGDGYLVNSLGDRLLGQAINEKGILDRTQLAPLRVRIGATVESADGATAKLIGYTVQRNGRLVGKYTDGVERTLGRLRIARFQNPQALSRLPGNLYRQTPQALMPLISDPGSDGAASILAAATELSNVDIGEQLIQVALARTQFRNNLATLDTADRMLRELHFNSDRRL